MSEAGTFANAARDASLELLEKGTLPDPPLSDVSLLQNENGVQWIKVDGIVQSVGLDDRLGAYMYVRKSNNLYRVEVDYNGPFTDLKKYLDAEVEIRGISTSLSNEMGQTVGFMLYSPGTEFITATSVVESGPFDLEPISIGELLTSPETGSNNHRVHVKGVVTIKIEAESSFFKTKPQLFWSAWIMPRLGPA